MTTFFPNMDRSHSHRGIGGDWRMNIAFPPVNIAKKEDNFHVSIAAPGYQKEDFRIETKGGKLFVSATHRESVEEQTDNYVHREYEIHSFERE
ncbi:MAG: Hsp20/alpha crystallin family protein, partial [Bacteroidota bacterium]